MKGQQRDRPEPESGRQREYERLRAEAASIWGPARASAIEPALRRTSDAIWKLARLEFRGDDRPGFFLTDLTDLPASSAGRGLSQEPGPSADRPRRGMPR